MTPAEFSNGFDTLLSSYNTPALFGEPTSRAEVVLDEYEKSLFLTEAQDQIVVELYTGRNTKGAAFETTEELRANLRGLIKTAEGTKENNNDLVISKNSTIFALPDDCLFITYEYIAVEDDKAGCMDGSDIPVVPVTLDEFHRIKKNPFRGANKRRALRLDAGYQKVEIVSHYNVGKYIIRYLSRPTPIVLANFDNEVKVGGCDTITECQLDPSIHREILERAVLLAINSKRLSQKSS